MKGISFGVSKNLLEANSLSNVLAKTRCPSTAGNRIFAKSKQSMVVDHFVRSVRHQSKNLPKHYEVLFTGSEVPTGPTELSQVQRDKRKLGTMCHALIAEHMFTPNLDAYTGDDAIIDTFTREDSVRATRSNLKEYVWKVDIASQRS